MAGRKLNARSILTAQRPTASAFSPFPDGSGPPAAELEPEAPEADRKQRAGRVHPGEAHRSPLETMTASYPAVLVLSITPSDRIFV